MTSPLRLAALALVALLAACEEPRVAAVPDPVEVDDEAVGHYCGMLLVDHDGPKGQIHLAGRAAPVWFSSVRDTIAFTRLPEESKDVAAIYVNDMARATDWAKPEPGAWITAAEAWYVIEGGMRGGMGAPEAVPFGSEAAAAAFAASHGGRLARLADIPDAYVLGPTDVEAPAGEAHPAPADHGAHGTGHGH